MTLQGVYVRKEKQETREMRQKLGKETWEVRECRGGYVCGRIGILRITHHWCQWQL